MIWNTRTTKSKLTRVCLLKVECYSSITHNLILIIAVNSQTASTLNPNLLLLLLLLLLLPLLLLPIVVVAAAVLLNATTVHHDVTRYQFDSFDPCTWNPSPLTRPQKWKENWTKTGQSIYQNNIYHTSQPSSDCTGLSRDNIKTEHLCSNLSLGQAGFKSYCTAIFFYWTQPFFGTQIGWAPLP